MRSVPVTVKGNLPHLRLRPAAPPPHSSAWTLSSSSPLYARKQPNLFQASTLRMAGRAELGPFWVKRSTSWPGLGISCPPTPPTTMLLRSCPAVEEINGRILEGDLMGVWSVSHRLAYEGKLDAIFDTVVSFLCVNFSEDQLLEWFGSVVQCASVRQDHLRLMRSGMINELVELQRLVSASKLALRFLAEDSDSVHSLTIHGLSGKINDIIGRFSRDNLRSDYEAARLQFLLNANIKFREVSKSLGPLLALNTYRPLPKLDPDAQSILELCRMHSWKSPSSSTPHPNSSPRDRARTMTNLRSAVRQKLRLAALQHHTEGRDDIRDKRWLRDVILIYCRESGMSLGRRTKALTMLRLRFLQSLSWRRGWSMWNDLIMTVCNCLEHFKLGVHIFRMSYGQYIPTERLSRTSRESEPLSEEESLLFSLIAHPNRAVCPPSSLALNTLVHMQAQAASRMKSKEVIIRFWNKMLDFEKADRSNLPDQLQIFKRNFQFCSNAILQMFGVDSKTGARCIQEYKQLLVKRELQFKLLREWRARELSNE